MAMSPALRCISRGLRGRCPACGEGRLFTAYLKQAPACTQCGAPTGQIAADDGPSWLTILMLGPLLATLTFIAARHEDWPRWITLPVLGVFAIGAVLFLLPRIKGALIGALWNMRNQE